MKRFAVGIVGLVTLLGAGSVSSLAFDPQPGGRYRFEYRVVVPAASRVGERLSIWIPYPVENEFQKILNVEVESPFRWEIRNEKKFGNRLIYIDGRTAATETKITFRYEVERRPSSGYPKESIHTRASLDPSLYRGPDRLVPLNRQIRAIAETVTRGLKSPSEKIQALYKYVVDTMTYNKEGTGWGNGDAIWACSNKRGNCTDFHSLFIALARTVGIPARFVIGVPIPAEGRNGTIPGYHCWAEVFESSRGWFPIDASEGKKSGRPADYFGTIPNNRIEFTVGRDLVLDPPQKGAPLNYFIYPYAELGGLEFKELKREFRFEKLS